MEVGDESAGDGVAGMRVGGVPVLFEGEGAGMGEEFLEVEAEGEGGGVFDVEVGGELDAGEVVVVGEVVDEALEFFFGVAVFSFESEEDITAGPVPMEFIEIGVEGMITGVLRGVAVVGFFRNAEGEAEAFVGARGDVAESEGAAA